LKNSLIALCISLLPYSAIAECNHQRQVETLALNMYHEARSDGIDAMIMVAEVTLNRVENSRYPNTICGVVYQRRQFSWTHTLRNHNPRERESWQTALILSREILSGQTETFNTGATHFLNPDLVRRIPRWAREYEEIGRVGNHVFYRENS